MVVAEMPTTPEPPDVVWEAEESWLLSLIHI